MFMRALTPLLETDSIQQTIDFYTSMLDFTVQETFEQEGQLRWCVFRKDNIWLMFSARNAGKQQPHMTGDLYFHLININGAWDALKDSPNVVQPIADMPWGAREFTITDNNGYTLRFGMDLKPNTEFDKCFPWELCLETDRVQLRILQWSDIEKLKPLTASETSWNYFVKELDDETAYDAWMKEALMDYGTQKRVPFVIIDKQRSAYAGSTSYGNISFIDKRIEIGWSWLGDEFKGTGVNTHAKFLLMRYAFETLGFERVEIKTDNLNERSKAALKKIGALPEGVLRSHMQMHSNRRRDSIYFAVLKNEWPAVKKEKFGTIA
jgi:N-acetyltransferase